MLPTIIARTFALAVRSLWRHRLRSVLTAFGMLFGVASVIAMLAIGEGGSYEAQQKFRVLGSRNILVETRKPAAGEQDDDAESSWKAQSYGITYKDVLALEAALPALQAVVPIRQVPKKAHWRDRRKGVQVLGTVAAYAPVAGVGVREGRFLSALDQDEKRNVAVLGAAVARELFAFHAAVGETIVLGGESFRVVGVLEDPARSSGSAEATRAADAVLVPLSAARAFFGELTIKLSKGSQEFERVELHRLLLQTADNDEVIPSARALRRLFEHRHRQKDDYLITVPLELIRQAQETQRVFSIVLASVAGISLLVGGIGIMNVMLATVTERTKEIGIRRALGARRHHVLTQFLIEAVVLALIGGLLGVALGVAIPELVTKLADQRTIVEPSFAALALGIAVLTAVAFGLYPAWRAATMDPVEALRHE